MEKRRVFVERYGEDNRDRRHDERHKHQRQHRPPKPPRPPRGPEMKMTTKLITSQSELVEYVNELGEKGHYIDIFKIEDGLYKVVVKERVSHKHEPRNIDIEIEE